MDDCIKVFFSSDVYKKILDLNSDQWLEIEQFSSFLFNNIQIFAVLDFAYKEGENISIYDWKTGKKEPDGFKLQPACYGLYALNKWGTQPEKVKLVEYYLSLDKQNEYSLTDFDLEEINQYISNSIEEMKDLLDDPQENISSENSFPISENDHTCRYCNFKMMCPKFRD